MNLYLQICRLCPKNQLQQDLYLGLYYREASITPTPSRPRGSLQAIYPWIPPPIHARSCPPLCSPPASRRSCSPAGRCIPARRCLLATRTPVARLIASPSVVAADGGMLRWRSRHGQHTVGGATPASGGFETLAEGAHMSEMT